MPTTDVNDLIISLSSIEQNDSTSHNFEMVNSNYDLLQSTSNHDLNVSYIEKLSYIETETL